MNFRLYSLSILVIVFIFIFNGSCSEPTEIVSAMPGDMEIFGLKTPARQIRIDEIDYYDSSGVYSDTSVDIEIYYFDSIGNQIRNEWWHNPTQKYLVQTWTYDSLGRKSYSSSNRSLTCTTKEKFFYDDSGKLVRKEIYSQEDSLLNTTLYKYNSAGLVIEYEILGHTRGCGYSEPCKYINEYDEQNRRIRSRGYFKNVDWHPDFCFKYSSDTVFEYEYGKDYRELKMTVYSDYDKNGAWTKSIWTCKMSDTVTRVVITTRTIEYY